jgi:hypothetical protein
MFIRDKPIFSPERMLHKDYGRKDVVAKKKVSGRQSSRGLGGKQPVAK